MEGDYDYNAPGLRPSVLKFLDPPLECYSPLGLTIVLGAITRAKALRIPFGLNIPIYFTNGNDIMEGKLN